MSTKMSPFRVLYGRDPPHVTRGAAGQTQVDSLDEWLKERDAILDELKYNLVKAQQRMKRATDNKRREKILEVGTWANIKIQPYRQKSLARRPNEKLSARYYGPFEIIQRIREVAYKLALPTTSRIRLVFHVSQLKRHIGTTPVASTIPPQLTVELELQVEPEDLLGVRRVGAGDKREALIKWKELPQAEATWEDVGLIQERFPLFHLEDKVNLWEGGNVIDPLMGPVVHVYARRGQKDRKVTTTKIGG